MVRHPYRPGQHGQARHSVSEFGKRLQEKQKIQILYGLNNHQMMRMFRNSDKDGIMTKLESRLDHVVFLWDSRSLRESPASSSPTAIST